jgi:hypothetical protein
MIVGVNGRSHPGNRGGRSRVGALQPRGRATGDGRQAHSSHRAPAPRACPQPAASRALAGWNRAFDAWLAAAGHCPAAGLTRDRAADDGRRPARAAVLRRAYARRASRAARAPCYGRDRGRRRRHRRVCSKPQHRAPRRPDRHRRACGAWAAYAAPICGQPRAPTGRIADDGGRGSWLCLERCGDKAILRRPFPRALVVRGRLGALDGRSLGRGGAQRDERSANAPGDPGRARGLRDSDDRAGDTRTDLAWGRLQLHPARGHTAHDLLGRAGVRRCRACPLTALAGLDGRRGCQRAQRLYR